VLCLFSEIKIADFGTSKRLAGLQLCTEDSVGTLQYMSPDVVLVPPMGYGPEVNSLSIIMNNPIMLFSFSGRYLECWLYGY